VTKIGIMLDLAEKAQANIAVCGFGLLFATTLSTLNFNCNQSFSKSSSPCSTPFDPPRPVFSKLYSRSYSFRATGTYPVSRYLPHMRSFHMDRSLDGYTTSAVQSTIGIS